MLVHHAMDGRGNYSTLEVAQGAYQQPGVQAEKQVAVADDSLPQPIPPSAPDCYKQDLGAGNGVNAYVQNNGYINTQQYVSPYEPGGYYSQPPQQPPPPVVAPSGRGKKWMCGLPPRVFWIIVGVAAVLVGVAATVASVVVMRKNQSGDGSGSQGSSGTNSTLATDPDAPILPGTRLAVGNWTDASTRFTHRAVVYQTRYALMVTYWDDSNRSWASVNVSASLARANNAITVKEGSPFAIGVTGSPWPFQMSIYYLTPQNVIGEVFCKNETTMDDWRIGDIHRRALRRAAPNTQLTSQWHRCSFGCSQHIYVVYEDDQNTIQLINSTDIQRQNVVVSNVTPGSALTMIPFLGENAKNGYQPYELRLFYQDSDLQEYKFNADRTWSKGMCSCSGDGYAGATFPQNLHSLQHGC